MSIAGEMLNGILCESCGTYISEDQHWWDMGGNKHEPIDVEEYIDKWGIPRYCSNKCWEDTHGSK